eukprot:8323063-Pyramimonas_sp.AAC.1
MSARAARPPSARPIQRRIFEAPEFRRRLEGLFSAVQWGAMSPPLQAGKIQRALRIAAAETRDTLFPPSPASSCDSASARAVACSRGVVPGPFAGRSHSGLSPARGRLHFPGVGEGRASQPPFVSSLG